VGWLGNILRRVRARFAGVAPQPVPAGQSATVEDVITRLGQIGSHLGGEGAGAFNTMYLRVTQEICDKIRHGFFTNSSAVERLDIVFAGMYIEAASVQPDARAACWAPVFDATNDRGCLPIQFAIAGMNAHINHDLPVAVVTTCRQLGLTPDSPDLLSDYNRVMDVLTAVQQEIRESFLSGAELAVDHQVAPVANLVGTWSIAKARDAAWTTAEVLWRLNEAPLVQADFLTTLDRAVGLTSQCLLVPVGQTPS
jgi:hypothetical protein